MAKKSELLRAYIQTDVELQMLKKEVKQLRKRIENLESGTRRREIDLGPGVPVYGNKRVERSTRPKRQGIDLGPGVPL